jgi:hypothetical protein
MLVRLRRFKTSRGGEDGTDVRPDQRKFQTGQLSDLSPPAPRGDQRAALSTPPFLLLSSLDLGDGAEKSERAKAKQSKAGPAGNKRGEHTQTKKPLLFSLLHHPSFLSLPLVSHPGSATPMS